MALSQPTVTVHVHVKPDHVRVTQYGRVITLDLGRDVSVFIGQDDDEAEQVLDRLEAAVEDMRAQLVVRRRERQPQPGAGAGYGMEVERG